MKKDKRIYNYVEYLLEQYHNADTVESRRKYLIAEAKNANSPTEQAAVSIVSDAYLCNVHICNSTIQHVLSRLDSADYQLIKLIYFDRSHTVTGAGMVVGMSKSVAYKHRNAIIRSIAIQLGYICP